jgi:hypothetical protein
MCFRPATIQQDKRCPKCSNSNTLDATHCSACGAELPAADATPQAAKPGAPMPGAFGQAGVDGGGFQPRIPKAPAPPASTTSTTPEDQ